MRGESAGRRTEVVAGAGAGAGVGVGAGDSLPAWEETRRAPPDRPAARTVFVRLSSVDCARLWQPFERDKRDALRPSPCARIVAFTASEWLLRHECSSRFSELSARLF